MAVAHDADGTDGSGSGTTFDYTGLTVGSGTNRALLAWLVTTVAVTSPTAHWDSAGANQNMTLLATANTGAGAFHLYLFGVTNPTSGAKNLHFAWTTTATVIGNAVSWTGADQTGGTTTFYGATTANDGGTAGTTMTITSASIATGDVGVAGCSTLTQTLNAGALNHTQWWLDTANGDGGNWANGAGATLTFTCTIPVADNWQMSCVGIKAAATQAPLSNYDQPGPQPTRRIDYAPAQQRARALLAGTQLMPAGRLLDWPFPPPALRIDTAPVEQRSPALLSGPQMMPVGRLLDWPDPIPPGKVYTHTIQRSDALLAGPQQMPAGRLLDWPDPLPAPRTDTAPVVQRSIALLSGPQLQPFALYDWPVPVPAPRTDTAPVIQRSIALLTGPQLQPFAQYDWPAVRTLQFNYAAALPPFVPPAAQTFMPSVVTDWGLTDAPPYPVDLRTAVGIVTPQAGPLPFNQTDWKLVPAADYPVDLRTTAFAGNALTFVTFVFRGPYRVPQWGPDYPVDLRTWTQFGPPSAAQNFLPCTVTDWGPPVQLVPFYPPLPPYNLALLSFVPPVGGFRLKIMTPGKVALSWDSDFPSGG